MPEAEAELVAGYIVEYSAMTFAFFFLAEYSNIILMNLLFVLLFLGGWNGGLLWKLLFSIFTFIWIRASLPRYRYDQLMTLGWKVFLPISLGSFFFLQAFYSLLIYETYEISLSLYREKVG